MSATPRILEVQCEWTSTDVADEELWTERFDDDRAGRARCRPASRPGKIRRRARTRV